MIYTSPIDFTNMEEISSNIEFYKNTFIRDGILVFRDANLSHEQHLNFHNMLGNNFGWHTYLTNSYTENHARLTTNDSTYVVDNNEVMLGWHVEHPYYSNPIIVGTWNMHKFTTDSENGKTYFVDTEKLFANMETEYQNFAKKCEILNTYKNRTHDLIGYHWISNNPVIRISHVFPYVDVCVDIALFDKREPTEDEVKTYKEMMKWIQNEIVYNTDIRIVHKWKQGDIVMPDMYKMCHAVTGGFDSKDRQFTGIWGYRYNDFKKLELECL